MKHFLPALFLFLFVILSPKNVLAAISLNISDAEKGESYYFLNANLSGISTSSACYVQVAITAPESPHYFGKTWSSKGDWFTYISSPTKEYIKENFIRLENDTPTKILFNSDPDDGDYKGPGEYLVKLKRYTGESSSSAGESNSLTFTIVDPTPTPTPTTEIISTPTSTITTTPIQTSTPTPTKTPIKTPASTPTPTRTSTLSPTVIATRPPAGGVLVLEPKQSPTLKIGSESAVLGDSIGTSTVSANLFDKNPSYTPEKLAKKSFNYKNTFFLGVLVSAASGALLYFRLRRD